MVQQAEPTVQNEVVATLNIGEPKHLYRQTSSSGKIEYLLEGKDTLTGVPGETVPDESQAAAQVTVVLVIRNFVRSFVQVRQEISGLLQTAETIDAGNSSSTSGSPSGTRRLQQAPQGEQAPAFGVLDATVTAMASCGNGVCEFGEAVGTFGYPEIWNCAQDCPFQMNACPAQV
jgi:hypothetical protein